MDANQLDQEFDALRRNFAQYRVEMALRFDSLERRLSTAESALARLVEPQMHSALPLLRSAPPPAPAPIHAYGSTATGFAERRRRAPPPINTALASSPQQHTPVYPPTPYVHQHQPSQNGFGSTKKAGSSENATFLPFVLEKIAASSQKKSPGDSRTCSCGRPTFDVKCFRYRHFDWCLSHQRPIIQGSHNCGSGDYRACQPQEEKHADWELLVKTSFDGGHLGTKEVKNLYEVLFPEDLYPEKYQGGWYVG